MLTRREFLVGVGAAASLPFMGIGDAFAAEKRPNFVFILTDDQRWDAMSCAGHPFLKTPNMDRIAKEGVRFTNAFVTTALCSPSRESFQTGHYVWSHGIKDNKTPTNDAIPTYSRLLQQAGYDTAFIGKWHHGENQDGPRPGFDRWVSFKGQGAYYNPTLNVDGQQVETHGYMTDLLTKYAVDWLKQPRNAPFCLCLCHKACHGPFTPAVRHSKLYDDAVIPKPPNFYDTLEGKPKWQGGPRTVEDRLPKQTESIKNYMRTLVGVDESIGRVLATLEEMGELDNTVIVFTGDNGFLWGEHGQGDKRVMYEESIRIPMLMRFPKLVKPSTQINQMVLNIDLAPTFLDLAGVKTPEGVQGESWKPLLKGKTSDWRKDFYYEYDLETPYVRKPEVRGIRTERWKYAETPLLQDIPELYDLKNDPYELHNLQGKPEYAKIQADLKARLTEMEKEAGYHAE